MDWQEFVDRGILTEIANVFSDESSAHALLESIGVARGRIPAFRPNAEGFWRQAARDVDNGLVPGRLDALVAAAAQRYPHNPILGRSAPSPSPAAPSSRQRLKVFLCHANEDKAAVRQVWAKLCADGFEPWLDEEDLLPGQNWRHEIPRLVRDTDVVVVFLSTQSVSKVGFVQKEIKLALDVLDEQPEGAIFLIPARLDECQVPSRLSDQHYVDLFDGNGYGKLRRALEVRAESLGMAVLRP